jgi:hypothetical protein
MRECWVNVYVWTDGRQKCGAQFPARKTAVTAAAGMPSTTPFHAAYRLHVRLKPSKFERATGLRETPAW